MGQRVLVCAVIVLWLQPGQARDQAVLALIKAKANETSQAVVKGDNGRVADLTYPRIQHQRRDSGRVHRRRGVQNGVGQDHPVVRCRHHPRRGAGVELRSLKDTRLLVRDAQAAAICGGMAIPVKVVDRNGEPQVAGRDPRRSN